MTSYNTNRARMEAIGVDTCIAYLREHNVPTKERKLSMAAMKSRHLEYDGLPTTYDYYRRFINDVLASVRKGKEDYVFELYQLRELLRFEPNLQITYNDGIFTVSLNTAA